MRYLHSSLAIRICCFWISTFYSVSYLLNENILVRSSTSAINVFFKLSSFEHPLKKLFL